MARLTCCVAVLLLGAPALAEQYWIAYEANGTFPEQEGWQRIAHGGGAERYLEKGALVLDGLASTQIVDAYQMYKPGALDPGSGELFVADWRLRIDEVVGTFDPTAVVYSDRGWGVAFDFNETTVRSFFEPGLAAPFEPYVYHRFELRSSDMRSYVLSIDGQAALAGSFRHVVSSSQVIWADGAQGSASLTHWDYFRFGVVPEPESFLLLGGSAALLRLRRLKRGAPRGAPAVRKASLAKEI